MEAALKYLFDLTEYLSKVRGGDPLPFQKSNYYPQLNEVYASDLVVVGTIPKDLSGAYIRVGPNTKYFVGGNTHA